MIGLDKHTVRLVEHQESWISLGARTCRDMRETCGGLVVDAQHVGSTAVPGLVAKPILDIAVGIAAPASISEVTVRLTGAGYLYRGDSGDEGGHLFVWESAPEVRTIHVHVVQHEGGQWRNYLAFRELLRRDAAARKRYTDLKLQLATKHEQNREAYTDAKKAFIGELLTLI